MSTVTDNDSASHEDPFSRNNPYQSGVWDDAGRWCEFGDHVIDEGAPVAHVGVRYPMHCGGAGLACEPCWRDSAARTAKWAYWYSEALCLAEDLFGDKDRAGPQPVRERACEACGRTMYMLAHRVRLRRYCCHDCAVRGARQRRRTQRLERMPWNMKPCAGCGEQFVPVRSDARFCSGKCKQKAYRMRKAADDV